MAREKKSADNPPKALIKKVLAYSKTDNWEDAKSEWEFYTHYYVEGGRRTCPGCGPNPIKHMSALRNKNTSQVIEISNSCAELYFDIDESSKIEYSVSRLKKNSNSLMNQSCLNYLLRYNAIHSDDADNYSMVGRQKVSHFKSYREIPNAILLNSTNYNNKNLFEKMDIIMAWIIDNSRKDGFTLDDIRNAL